MNIHPSSVRDILLRRYEIRLAPAAGQSVQVAATPLLFDAHRERGDTRPLAPRGVETAWSIGEERAEWQRLFRAIRRHLETAAAETAGDAPAEGTP